MNFQSGSSAKFIIRLFQKHNFATTACAVITLLHSRYQGHKLKLLRGPNEDL